MSKITDLNSSIIPIDEISNYLGHISKVRGSSFDEKLNCLIARYKKVILNCSNTEELYRLGFLNAHNHAVELLTNLSDIETDSQIIICKLSIEAYAGFINSKIVECESSAGLAYNLGREDAYGLIALECATSLGWI